MNLMQARPLNNLTTQTAKPFVKWAGGKSRLLPALRQLVPPAYNRYFEPFLGGAAMFFDLEPAKAILSDTNEELINCYEVVRNHPLKLIEEVSKYRISEKEFLRVRAYNPSKLSKVSRAARFIFLNKTCFNGLYRVNSDGKFNTPFGHYKKLRLVDEANLLAASLILKYAQLERESYDKVLLQKARPGDFIYLDPPYLPISHYSDFKRYTPSQFHETDHEQLASVFKELDKRGCYLLLSNSYHPKVKKLYGVYKFTTVLAPRFINCRGNKRGLIKELVISNH